MVKTHKLSIQRSCGLLSLKRSSYYYKSHPKNDNNEREALKCLAYKRLKWGLPLLLATLKLEGLVMNHKKANRIYKEEKLQLPKKYYKKTRRRRSEPPVPPTGMNERWSMDFMADRLLNGRLIRIFAIIDDFTRECLWMGAARSLCSVQVVQALDVLIHIRGKPKTIVTDNGPEFTSRLMDQWRYSKEVCLHFIDPGKPTQNAFIESFNGKFKNECLNEHWFYSLDQAQDIIRQWRQEYNAVRPHSSLGYKTPIEFAYLCKNQLC